MHDTKKGSKDTIMVSPDAATQPGVTFRLDTPAGLTGAWRAFREGAVVLCAYDGGQVSVAVDAPAGTYRLGCVKCGAASSWFESGPAGMRPRTTSIPPPPGPSR